MGSISELTQTEIGRATSVNTSPATSAWPRVSHVRRAGESSNPSITNSPIWANQARPSEKERVAIR